MTRDEVAEKLRTIVSEQLGGVIEPQSNPKNLQEAFGCTSLDVVSIQVSIEEAFSLKFAVGAHDRGPIDEAWDSAKSLDDLTDLVLKFRC